jgi:hypothetical protein
VTPPTAIIAELAAACSPALPRSARGAGMAHLVDAPHAPHLLAFPLWNDSLAFVPVGMSAVRAVAIVYRLVAHAAALRGLRSTSCASRGFTWARFTSYFNYGLTALVVTAVYTTALLATERPSNVLFWSLAAFCVLFPLWFFRYARALWLGMDEFLDPPRR